MEKKFAAIVTAMALTFCMAGCAQQTPAAVPEATPAPAMAPTGMVKAFGRDIRIGCIAEAEGDFAQGAMAQAAALGIPLELVSDAGAYDVLIAASDGVLPSGVPAILYTDNAGAAPEGSYVIRRDPAQETEAALAAMFQYPSHEAPVRILGLFTSDGNAAHAAYMKMGSDGKLQSKGVWTPEEMDAAQWLAEALNNIAVGVLDTVYAQDPALAMKAFAALQRANRNDAVEVCAAGLTQEQILAMAEDHFLMGTAVGYDEYAAGALAVRMAACLVAGEPMESVVQEPLTVRSDAVRAFMRTGGDPAAFLKALDKKTDALFQREFLKELAGDNA